MSLFMLCGLHLLKALADPTRLRIVALLQQSELAVSDLTRILRQSQPRVSRHLKILAEAHIVERHKEGAWVFLRLAEHPAVQRLLVALQDDSGRAEGSQLADLRALSEVIAERRDAAQTYFAANAAAWDQVRSMYVAEEQVEAAIARHLWREPVETLLDLGTGTGRMLEIFGPRLKKAVGVDINPEMLRLARAKLEAAGLGHCQVRLGDLYTLEPGQRYDVVLLHQVLHFTEQPAQALVEAAGQVAPGGRLLLVDFAPHDHEALRERHQHRRLGFADAQILDWLADAGLAAEVAEALPSRQLTVKLWVGRRPEDGEAVARVSGRGELVES